MEEPHTWRELLGRIIQDPRERERIAQQVGIHSMTLTRWVNGEATPHSGVLHRVLEALPEQQVLLRTLLTEEFPAFSPPTGAPPPSLTVPPACYVQVLMAYTQMPQPLSLWSISKLVLQQALEQLDPQQERTAVMLVRCLPPSSGKKIRSLLGVMGVGRPPWGGKLEEQNQLLGAESFSGYVVSSGRPALHQNTEESPSRLPATVYTTEWPVPQDSQEPPGRLPPALIRRVASEAAVPVRRAGRMAGSLHVCSSLPHALQPSHLTLLQQYADLVGVAFEWQDFYEPEDIELSIMPPWWVQAPYLFDFQKRVTRLLREAARNQQSRSGTQAELVAWQELEEEFTQLHFSSEG